MKIKFLCLFLLSCVMSTMSAQKKSFELDQLIPGGNGYLQADAPKGVSWFGDKLMVIHNDEIYTYSANGKLSSKPLISLVGFNKALTNKNIDTQKGLPSFSYMEKEAISYIDGSIVFYDIDKKEISKVISFDSNDNSFDLNPRADMVAVRNGDSLFVISNGERLKVSENETPDIVWGDAVHRNEFGIHKGTFWSPKGNLLAFYRMDESMVSDYPLVINNERVAKHSPIKYPMAGMPSHEVTVGIFNPATGETVYIAPRGGNDHYSTNIAWSDDEKYLYIAELNREQNEMNLNQYDAQNGKYIKTLFTEKSDTYVEPENPVMFVDNDRFIWISERDGYDHIYLYSKEGEVIRQLTSGQWEVQSINKIDRKNGVIYFTSTEESPLDTDLYSLNINTGEKKRITTLSGTHYVKISESGNYIYDRYVSNDVPGRSYIINTKTGKQVIIHESEDFYADYEYPEITVGTIKAADGETDLYYRLTTPVGFDPEKKYPAVVYLYNGPHAQLITNTYKYGIRGWDVYMAQKGYVVFTIDGRGSARRGGEFERAIHRNLGLNEGKDQMKGIEYLTSLPYVDSQRIGIHGWSYGGFMTTYMMLNYPDTFKAGVAGGPVMDWKMYEVMYGERYMGSPESNPEGYANNNLPEKAAALKGRLLLIHGDIDPVVVMQHTFTFLKRAVDERVYPDLYIYPGHEHNVRGIDRVHLSEKIARYFDDYLK